MHLRLLFYSRIGQLCRERKALLRHMADEQDVGANIGLDDVSVRLSEVSDLAEQLRANGADEYRTYMQFSSAFSRGVSLSYPPPKKEEKEGGRGNPQLLRRMRYHYLKCCSLRVCAQFFCSCCGNDSVCCLTNCCPAQYRQNFLLRSLTGAQAQTPMACMVN